MSAYEFDVGIMGGGAAGLTVAAGAAQAGAKVLLAEKDESLGGDCLHYGCVPSKTLIMTAQVYHLMKNARRFGLPETAVQRPDYRKIAARIQSVIGTIQKHDSDERFCGLGAKVEHGQALFGDEHSISLNGKRYSAKNWVIATGSSAAKPPIEGIKETPCITNKEASLETYITGASPISTTPRAPDIPAATGGLQGMWTPNHLRGLPWSYRDPRAQQPEERDPLCFIDQLDPEPGQQVGT